MHVLVAAGGQLVERRVLDGEIGVTHGAVHVHDGVAGRARQARMRFRRIDLLFDGAIETAVKEDRVVVAAGAPFAGLRPDH